MRCIAARMQRIAGLRLTKSSRPFTLRREASPHKEY
jgi:hypothetical protein